MMIRIAAIAASVLGLLGTAGIVWRSCRTVTNDEHQARIEAQIDLRRAEIDLALPDVVEEAVGCTERTARRLNAHVRETALAPSQEVTHDLDELARALNAALGI
jgi:hypothetical protein